jgi:hypothetical protein
MGRSLEVNRDRFKISPQLQSVLENTARELGWLNDQGHLSQPGTSVAATERNESHGN